MKIVKLCEVTKNITDGKHGDCEPSDNSGFYFISCKDVKDGQVDYGNARQITESSFNEANLRTQLEPNDILLTNSGTIGRMALIKDEPRTHRTTFQKSVAIIKPDTDKVVPNYLYYQLQNCVTEFINRSNGSAQKNLLLSTMRAFELHIHEDFGAQNRLANVLSAYDNLIENNQKQIKLLEEAAQRLYQEWFVKLRFPGHEKVKVVDGLPEGWRHIRVSDLGEIVTGKTPPTSNVDFYGGDIPFVKIPDMHGVVFPIKTEVALSRKGADTQKGKYIPANSIIVSCIATVGLVNITTELCQTNQQINAIVPYTKSDLYYIYFTMKRLKSLLDGVGSNGATMTNVNKTKFGKLEILYPDKESMKKYFEICKPIFDRIMYFSMQNEFLAEARDRLLPKLMGGEIEV